MNKQDKLTRIFQAPPLIPTLPGSNSLPLVISNMIKRFSNNTITNIKIKRTALSKLLTSLINIISLNQFQQNIDEQGIDTLYHLYMVVTLDNGTNIIIEKNSRLNMEIVSNNSRPNTEEITINDFPSGMTLQSIMSNVQKFMGLQRLISYSAKSNNCQDYILALCQSNHIGNTSEYQFIKQDTVTLFSGLDYLRKFTNTVTGLDANINQVINGGSIKNNWITHVKNTQIKNQISYKDALKIASKTYKK